MREVSFTTMAVFLIFTSLKGTSLVFSLLSLFWWGGRAGLMRQIANLLTVVRRSGGSNPLPIVFMPV